MYSRRICSVELFIVVKLENKTFIWQMRLLYSHVPTPRTPSAPYSRVVQSLLRSIAWAAELIKRTFMVMH